MLRWTLLALVLSGCMSVAQHPSPTDSLGSATTTVPPTTTTTVGLIESLETYRHCLNEQGLEITEIPIDGFGRPRFAIAFGGVPLTDKTLLEALNACAVAMSAHVLDLSTDPQLATMIQNRLDEYAVCMRIRGVDDFPDPVPMFNGIGSPFNVRRVPWDDLELTAAAMVCGATLTQHSS